MDSLFCCLDFIIYPKYSIIILKKDNYLTKPMDIRLATFRIDVFLAISTFLAIIVALFNQKFWDWINRPKIKFCLSNSPPYIIQKMGKLPTWIKYFRFKVINEGRTVAKNCQVKLISAEPIGKKLNFPLIEPDKLKWSGAPKDTRYINDELYPTHKERIDIHPLNGWEFCDLFRIESTYMIELKFMSPGERKVPITGEYIITIEISGDNFKPRKAEIITSIPSVNRYWETQINWAKNNTP